MVLATMNVSWGTDNSYKIHLEILSALDINPTLNLPIYSSWVAAG